MTEQYIEAENAVLGSILIDARCLDEVTRTLRPRDFAMEVNQALYRAILRLDRAGRSVDPVTVLDEARQAGDGVSRTYVLDLMDITPTAANVSEYVKIVREGALRRGAAAVTEYVTGELSAHTPVQDVLMEAARRIEDLQKEAAEDLLDPDGVVLAFYEHRERIYQGGDAAFVRTGYQDLDNRLGGGMLNSGMYVLAARPGVGKTTLALNIADRAAKNGLRVLFVSLEMDPEQLEAKRLARETGIPGSRLLMSPLTDEEETRVARAADVIRALPVYVNKRDTATVAQVEQMARRIKGLGLIVVDYIGKLLPEPRGRKLGRTEYMTEISGELKNLARRFRVPVLALCQLNREVEGRRGPPILSDLRDTGAIEQDADGVIFLHRTDYYKPQAGSETADLQVNVAKNRHGPVGECMMTFELPASRLTTSRRQPAYNNEVSRALIHAGQKAKRAAKASDQLSFTELTGEDKNLPF